MFSHTNMKELLVLTVFMIKLTCIKDVKADAIVANNNCFTTLYPVAGYFPIVRTRRTHR